MKKICLVVVAIVLGSTAAMADENPYLQLNCEKAIDLIVVVDDKIEGLEKSMQSNKLSAQVKKEMGQTMLNLQQEYARLSEAANMVCR